MRYLKWAGIIISVIILSNIGKTAIAVPEFAAKGDLGEKMEEYITRLHRFGFDGSVLVAKGDSVIFHDAVGTAQVPNDIAIHTGTLFSTGSVTKQFTAAAIMRLEADGKLTTADKITKYFKDVPEDKKDITIYQLLTHSSGLPHSIGADEDPIGRDSMIAKTMRQQLLFAPGEKYEYSNAGYSLLAAIVEIVSGTEYEQYLKEKFFDPLGMTHTGIHLLDVPDTLIAFSQNAQMGYPSPKDRPKEYYYIKGNGGMLSTTADMYRWHRALLDNSVLPEAQRTEMFTPHIKEYEDGDSYYGFGWVIQKSGRGTTVIWHNGGAMPHGWSCAIYRYIDDDAVFIVFSNKTFDGALPVDFVVQGLATLMFTDMDVMPPQTVEIPADEISRFAGKYDFGDAGTIVVSADENGIVLKPSGQQILDMLFPSPYAPMLPKYNNLTSELLTILAAGDYEKATDYFRLDMASQEDWVAMSKEWWQSFDTLGAFRKVEIIGTVGADGAKTHAVVYFDKGTVPCHLGWMAGKCEGMSTDEGLTKTMPAASANRFVAYNLPSGRTIVVEFDDGGKLHLRDGEKELVATLLH